MRDCRFFLDVLSRPLSGDIVLIVHANPDADALGSALGFALYLQKKGHHVRVISPSVYSVFLGWMSAASGILCYDKQANEVLEAINKAALLVYVDFSSPGRMGGLADIVLASSVDKALVDHHPNKMLDARYCFWSPGAAATSEIMYDLIVKDRGLALVDRDIAECLYAGLMTDTGSFRFASTSARVHYITASLINCGVRVSRVNGFLYENNSLDRMRFIGYCLMHCLRVYAEEQVAFLVLKEKEVQDFNPQAGDTEGFVNYALSIKGILIAVLLKEQQGKVRMSFRSKGCFPVNEIALQHFSGGGHLNAAGGSSQDDVDVIIAKIKQILSQSRYKRLLARAAQEQL